MIKRNDGALIIDYGYFNEKMTNTLQANIINTLMFLKT